MSEPRTLGLAWQINLNTGWGVFGLNIALDMARRRSPELRLICPSPMAHLEAMPPWHRRVVGELEGRRIRNPVPGLRFWREQAAASRGSVPEAILYALGNNFVRLLVEGDAPEHRRIGVVFLEGSRIKPEAVSRAQRYHRLLAGSSWNEQVMRGHGLDQAIAVFQGVDLSLFHPRPPSGVSGERFVVFSGGALEFRKGQDIIAAAFRAFQARHPEALLVTCWHTPSAERAATIGLGRHAAGVPAIRADGTPNVAAWLAGQGIPAHAVFECGYVPYPHLPNLLGECDAAVFASRVEGGTNLFAMQAVASGVPTLVSANTGHLDLIRLAGLRGLERQAPVAISHLADGGTDGWGESDTEELVEALETIWRDRAAARRDAAAAATRMAEWSWPRRIDHMLEVVGS
ncbi:MAG: glycosyltransferase family 4 protein [Alphaproteobacteria bacterium]|nr:glycosyltransferase family 4 protein [Alphaproteobacteria bacterium]